MSRLAGSPFSHQVTGGDDGAAVDEAGAVVTAGNGDAEGDGGGAEEVEVAGALLAGDEADAVAELADYYEAAVAEEEDVAAAGAELYDEDARTRGVTARRAT